MAIFQARRELWLASASPRRRALLEQLGLSPRILAPRNAEPEPLPGEPPQDYVLRAASAKSQWALEQAHGCAIIAADTIVCANGAILGKPKDLAHAVAMLKALNGRWHHVYTGVIVTAPALQQASFHAKTAVRFANWPENVLRAYAGSGESLDKAGAYGIQDKGAFLADAMAGSWSNVVGLPLAPLIKILLDWDIIAPA